MKGVKQVSAVKEKQRERRPHIEVMRTDTTTVY